jgi:hypothetical protein
MQPDRWVSEIVVEPDTKARYIGTTKEYLVTAATQVKDVSAPKTIRVGDEIEGMRIGAIRCMFHSQDAKQGNEPYMWRGRWGCLAGRSEMEVQNAVRQDGSKAFDYIYIAPVTL